jgi:hypothetical protein
MYSGSPRQVERWSTRHPFFFCLKKYQKGRRKSLYFIAGSVILRPAIKLAKTNNRKETHDNEYNNQQDTGTGDS